MTFTLGDHFAGCGGLTQGAGLVPGVEPLFAANHEKINMDSHQANFPDVAHYCEDVRKLDLAKFPRCDLFHASPTCPVFSDARGERQHFDADAQGVLFEDELGAVLRDDVRQGRLLMHEVPRYLEAMALRGRPVLAGTVENVVQARKWGSWHAWTSRIRNTGPGYEVRVIAVNSMHLRPVAALRPPQSRDRLLVMFWLKSVGRRPDADKWLLRPRAWCPACEEWVAAMQVFKKPGQDMGRYGSNGQYWYRCPRSSCRNQIVEPAVLGAEHAIDWTRPGTPISERTGKPLEESTLRKIRQGITEYWTPLLVPSGGTWRDKAVPLSRPMPARTTRETDAVALPPFITVLRGQSGTKPVTRPLTAITAGGGHHGLVTPPPMLVPYYTKGHAQTTDRPMGALSTRDRYGLATADRPAVDVREVRYRMLTTTESAAGMGFQPGYIIYGDVKQRTRQIGQAVTPVLGELAYYAHIEMLTGQELEPAPWTPPPGIPSPVAKMPGRRRRAAAHGDNPLFD